MYMYVYTPFIHSSIDGHLGCNRTNKTKRNILIDIESKLIVARGFWGRRIGLAEKVKGVKRYMLHYKI